MHFLLLLIPLVSVTSSIAAPIPANAAAGNHVHSIEKRLPGTWYHHPRHAVHDLFRRASTSTKTASSSSETVSVDDDDDEDLDQDDDDDVDSDSVDPDSSDSDSSEFPEVGTPEWAEGFPTVTTTPDPDDMPQEWKDALKKAVKAGKIPKVPKSTQSGDDRSETPKYPKGTDPTSPEVCSSSYKCKNPGSLWDAPDGYFGTGFDDGPTPATTALLDFLQSNEEQATHFMIGVNILQNPDQFKATFQQGDDIGVHTWSHPAMTTLSNEEIVSEIGWTMQLIRNSTGGRIPRFWRPPYGDSDARVEAIAHEIFGLRTIIYNTDTDDWNMATGQKTKQEVDAAFESFIDGPQSPGLITLEHETTEETVQAFIKAYPQLKEKGWKLLPVTQLFDNLNTYQNVQGTGDDATVTQHGIIHEDTDAGDDLDAPVGPSKKVKDEDNGVASVVMWTKSGLSKALLVSMAVMFVL